MSDDGSKKHMAEYVIGESEEGEFFIRVFLDRQVYDTIGPFDTEAQANEVLEELLQMMRETGAKDMPVMQ